MNDPRHAWRKSTFSGQNSDCVEVAPLSDGRVMVRNSNRLEDGTLLFSAAEMAAWIAGCRAGEFDDLTR